MHSFTPVTTSCHKRIPQKPLKSLKRGRWGSLHACIAWQIYYKEKLKKVQLRSKHLHPERLPKEDPSIRCTVDHPCGGSTCRNFNKINDRKTVEKLTHYHNYVSHLHHHTPESKWDTQHPKELCNEMLHGKEEQPKQLECGSKALTVTDMTWTQGDAPLNNRSSHDRKRHLEYPSFCRAKRFKQEAEEEFWVSTNTGSRSHTTPVQHVDNQGVFVFYSNSNRCTTVSGTYPPRLIPSYTAVNMYQHQSASWDEYMNIELRSRPNVNVNNMCTPCGFTPFYCRPVFKQQNVTQKGFLQETLTSNTYTNYLFGALNLHGQSSSK